MLESLLEEKDSWILDDFTKIEETILIDEIKFDLNKIINYPKIFENNSDWTITVQIFWIWENWMPIQRHLIVTDENINNLKSNKIKLIKEEFEKELWWKLDKFVKNKKHRKALYYTFFRLSFWISHIETIKETAFYIKELYWE